MQKCTVDIIPFAILFCILFFIFSLHILEYQHIFLPAMASPAVITSHGTQGRVPGVPAHLHTPFFRAVFTAKREEMQTESESPGLFGLYFRIQE